MKKIIILLIGICLVQTSCKGQNNDEKNDSKNKTKNKKNIIMKKIDEKKLMMFKSYDKQEYVVNDTLFKLDEFEDIYIEIAKPIHENFQKHSVYDKKNLKLKREGQVFDRMPIGVHKFYDEKGNLIKETDFDRGFNFTINDLLVKVKKELKINLNNDLKGIEISRGMNKKYNIPVYNIFIPVKTEDNSYPTKRHIIIEGTTGNIISDLIEVSTEW